MPNLDVTIAKHDLAKLLDDNAEQAKHITDLQARMTAMQEAQLSRRVRAFHLKFGHPVRTTPLAPVDEEVRFRLKLIAEEFVELLEATLATDVTSQVDERSYYPKDIKRLREKLAHVIANAAVCVNLPECYDALLDIAYVVEGAHCVLGTSAEPGMAEVQRANLSKDPNGPDGKPVKPPGWTPPDHERVLRAQGWVG